MTPASAVAALVPAAGFAAAGLLVGLGYFAALRRTAALLVGGGSWLAPLALTALRIAAVVALLGTAVRGGATPLLAGFAGVMLARAIALRAPCVEKKGRAA